MPVHVTQLQQTVATKTLMRMPLLLTMTLLMSFFQCEGARPATPSGNTESGPTPKLDDQDLIDKLDIF